MNVLHGARAEIFGTTVRMMSYFSLAHFSTSFRHEGSMHLRTQLCIQVLCRVSFEAGVLLLHILVHIVEHISTAMICRWLRAILRQVRIDLIPGKNATQVCIGLVSDGSDGLVRIHRRTIPFQMRSPEVGP